MQADVPAVAMALMGCLVGAITDFRRGLIPNWLTFPMMGLALLWGVWRHGCLVGVASGVLGFVGCGFVPLMLYRKKGMGGGDVKLLAAVGALLGWRMGLEVEMASFAVGALYGAGVLLGKREFFPRMATILWPTKITTFKPHTMRFGPSILVGFVCWLGWSIGTGYAG